MLIAHISKITNFKLGVYLGCNKKDCNKKEQFIVKIIASDNEEENGVVIVLCETHLKEFINYSPSYPTECLN